MAAELQPEPQTSETINRRIAGAVRALVAANNATAEDMTRLLDMKRATYYRRLRDGGWSATDIALVAQHFGVNVGDIYEGHVMVICGLIGAGVGLVEPAGLWRPGQPERRRWVRRRSDRERFRVIQGEGRDKSGQRSLLVRSADELSDSGEAASSV